MELDSRGDFGVTLDFRFSAGEDGFPAADAGNGGGTNGSYC
jgi:hypothetical protein